MSVSEFLEFLLESKRHSGYIAHIQKIPGRDAVFSNEPEILPAKVRDWLSKEGIRLYSHQAERLRRSMLVKMSSSALLQHLEKPSLSSAFPDDQATVW